jgi:hypothetical protein
MGMHDGTKRNVTKIRRSIVVTNHAVGKKSERMGVVAVKFPCSLHADTSASVGMVNKDDFSAVGVGFFNGWKFPSFGSEWFTLLDNGRKDSRYE